MFRLGSTHALMEQTNRGRFQMFPLKSPPPQSLWCWNMEQILQEQKLHFLPEGGSVCHGMCSHLALFLWNKCLDSTLSSRRCLATSCITQLRVLWDTFPPTHNTRCLQSSLTETSRGMGMPSLYPTGESRLFFGFGCKALDNKSFRVVLLLLGICS